MRRHRTLPVVLAVSLVALAGCGGGDPKSGASASTSASPAPSSAPTTASGAPSSTATDGTSDAGEPSGQPDLPTSRVEAASLHLAVLGENAASTDEEKAVVAAWMDFWQGAADTYYYYRPTAGFEKVARGKARSSVLSYLAQTKASKQRVVGWSRDNVTSVKVDGESATVRDCTKNFTFSVDEGGEPITLPDPWYDVTGTLVKADGAWTVTVQSTKALKKSCLS